MDEMQFRLEALGKRLQAQAEALDKLIVIAHDLVAKNPLREQRPDDGGL